MGKLNVKNGTPVGSEHLCKSCHHGQVTTGYRKSDVLVVCTNVYPSFRLPFVVHDCSDFEDKRKPEYEPATEEEDDEEFEDEDAAADCVLAP